MNLFDEVDQIKTQDLFDEVDQIKTNRLSVGMEQARKKDPRKAAEDYKLSDETGLPVEYIESNKDKVNQYDYDSLRKRAPLLAEMIQDKRNAEIAQNELDNLSWFEEVARETKNIAKIPLAAGFTASQSLYGAGASIASGIEYIPSQINEATIKAYEFLGLDRAAEAAKDARADYSLVSDTLLGFAEGQKASREHFFPKPDETRVHPAVLGGIESFVINTGAISTSLLTRNPGTALSVMGGVSYGTSYVDGKEAGLSDFDASVFAANNTIAEVVTEKIPLGALLSDIDKNTGFTKMLGKQMLAEGITEQVATVWQDALSWAAINPEKTLEEFMDERGDAAYNTLISTMVSTGLQTSAVAGINKLAGGREPELIERIVEKAKESQYRELDKANFENYLQEVAEEHGGVDSIYINANELEPLLNEFNKNDPSYDLINKQIDEALELNGDVVIPVGEFASTIAASENYNIIKDLVRLSPDPQVTSINAFERIQEAQKNIEQNDEARKIYSEIADQLKETGKLTPSQARVAAEVIPAFLGANPERMGITISEAYEMMGIKIIGPQEDIQEDRLTSVVEAMKRGEDTQETQDLKMILDSQGIDMNEDSGSILNKLSSVREFKQKSTSEEVVKSDPLMESTEWREQTISATLDDGTKESIRAGQAYDIITSRREAAESILECINANP